MQNRIKKMLVLYLTLMLISGLFKNSTASAENTMNDSEITEAYYKSYAYERVGNYTNAINALAMVYQAYPKTYTINIRLGYLNYLNQRYANAVKYYDAAHTIAPESLSPRTAMMLVLNTQTQYSDSEAIGYQILKIDPYNYYANLYLLSALRLSKKYEAGAKIALKMLAIAPSDISFLLEYGWLTLAQSDTQKAYGAFNYVLLLDPENVSAKQGMQLLTPKKNQPK